MIIAHDETVAPREPHAPYSKGPQSLALRCSSRPRTPPVPRNARPRRAAPAARPAASSESEDGRPQGVLAEHQGVREQRPHPDQHPVSPTVRQTRRAKVAREESSHACLGAGCGGARAAAALGPVALCASHGHADRSQKSLGPHPCRLVVACSLLSVTVYLVSDEKWYHVWYVVYRLDL